MDPRQLSHELREGASPDMTRRRWVIGLSMVGAAMGAIVSLYQTGVVRHLPDPPVGPFDSDRVDASTYAYSRLSSPDGPAMLVSYGITAWLAAAGGMDRSRTMPWLPVAMGAKVLGDLAVALELGREEWAENQALCAYCQLATLASLASVAVAAPEVLRSARALLGRGEAQPAEAFGRTPAAAGTLR